MREIKFRIWDSGEKSMCRNATIKQYMEAPEIVVPDGEKFNVMQYTGIKDKNGVEIYEGDVCKYKNSSPSCPDTIFAISWDNKQARFCETYSTYIGDGSFLCSDKMEIIGNIYQNPELLK